jgi:argininosuccinate synthase
MNTAPRCVLAYSGGLDTSILIHWLSERGWEVHCMAADVGQGALELDGLEAKALATGAASCVVADLRSAFVDECIWPALRALAVYQGRYLLGTSLARPVIARAQAQHARDIGAVAVAHGCTGKGNDQVRFELGYMAFAPELQVLAPWREWDITSREEAIDYAEKHAIPITASRTKIWSRDRNLWHISHEGGAIENPASAPPDEVWMLTVDPAAAPDKPVIVELEFEAGCPVAMNGTSMLGVSLIESLNTLAGQHGVGRVDVIEDRLVGMKSRGLYETPAGTVLYEALRTLRALTMERETAHLAERLSTDYAKLVYNGQWFHPAREALDGFFAEAMRTVSGTVQVKLHKGHANSIGCTSPHSLYRDDLASFTMEEGFAPADSGGFIRLFGLPGTVAQGVRHPQPMPTSTTQPAEVLS